MKKTLLAVMAMVSLCGYAQIPIEGFESLWVSPGPNLPAAPPGWTVVNEWGPNVTWQQSIANEPDSPPYGGNHAAYLQRESIAPTTPNPKDWLISPSISIPPNAQLQFQSRLTLPEDQGGIYKVYLGTDTSDLSTFTEIYSATELEINPIQTNYNKKYITIPSQYVGMQLHIAFVMIGDNADRWFIDDVGVFTACNAPSDLTATNIDLTSAQISWTENGEATQWELQITAETEVPTGVGVIVNDNSYVFNGLVPGMIYKCYIRATCADGGFSTWAGPYYFPESPCPVPTNVTLSASGTNSLTYTWTPTIASSYDYWITTVNNATPNASTVPTGSVPSATAIVAPLVPGVNYKFYVRSNCGSGSVSPWVGITEPLNTMDNVLHGKIIYDSNADGVCNENDAPLPFTEIQVTGNGATYSVYANQNGEYSIYNILDGAYTFNLQVVSSLFTSIAPIVQEVTFTEEVNEVSVNHCLGQPVAVNDLEVTLIATTVARPGFDAGYNVVVHNAGSMIIEDAVVNLTFDDERISYVSSGFTAVTPATGTLSIALGDVQPFSVVNGNVVFHVMAPPVNIGGEILHFEAGLSDVLNDATPDNNDAVLNQVTVNSFDPNDITVHEGAKIYEDQADEYLTYTIRFQNTGSAEAINIRLQNTLDELLDWSTFMPVASSHTYTAKRTNDIVEFEYKNILLPDNTTNEVGSHGYVTYKIKPKAEYGLGDIVSNTAGIYFDFNPAIITNTATTEVVELTAGVNDNAIAIARLYPNPVTDELRVAINQGELQSVTVYDINGRLCLSANAETIDTSILNSGIYFVKVTTDAGSANYKIIKH